MSRVQVSHQHFLQGSKELGTVALRFQNNLYQTTIKVLPEGFETEPFQNRCLIFRSSTKFDSFLRSKRVMSQSLQMRLGDL
jgi:hypothetical protein